MHLSHFREFSGGGGNDGGDDDDDDDESDVLANIGFPKGLEIECERATVVENETRRWRYMFHVGQ